MKTFKDLVNSGIAATKATFWGKTLPGNLAQFPTALCNEYNATYGQASNTLMSPCCDKLCCMYITGEAIRNGENQWKEFINAPRWHDVDFKCPLAVWLSDRLLEWEFTVVNGAFAVKVKRKVDEKK